VLLFAIVEELAHRSSYNRACFDIEHETSALQEQVGPFTAELDMVGVVVDGEGKGWVKGFSEFLLRDEFLECLEGD
jgi:hypothetical protein